MIPNTVLYEMGRVGAAEVRQRHSELIHFARQFWATQHNLHSDIGTITSGQEEKRW